MNQTKNEIERDGWAIVDLESTRFCSLLDLDVTAFPVKGAPVLRMLGPTQREISLVL